MASASVPGAWSGLQGEGRALSAGRTPRVWADAPEATHPPPLCSETFWTRAHGALLATQQQATQVSSVHLGAWDMEMALWRILPAPSPSEGLEGTWVCAKASPMLPPTGGDMQFHQLG